MSPAPRTLSTADERREDVLRSAMAVFAQRGYHGTPTTEIAKAAGISQAYLFRLFPTKLDLFVALTQRCYHQTLAAFEEAARRAAAEGADPLEAMAEAYGVLVADRTTLLFQLQTHAATSEPAVRDAVRRGFAELYELVARVSGADRDRIQSWFAYGMLMNVVVAMRADEVESPWAEVLCHVEIPADA